MTCTASKRRSPATAPRWRGSRASSCRTGTAAPRAKKYKELDDDLPYTANQLDRDVVAENQIRLVIRTFRDKLFTEIFPGRNEVPKTLVFAKTDLHAEDMVRIIREEFGKGNDFCQKITSKTHRQEARRAAGRLPQLLQPAHRRDRGHDRHGDGREAARMPAVHAEHPVARLFRADEGPRLPRHRPRRAANGDARRHGRRRTSSSWMRSACARKRRRRPSRSTASQGRPRQGAGRGCRRGRRPRHRVNARRPAGAAATCRRPTPSGRHRPGRRRQRPARPARRAAAEHRPGRDGPSEPRRSSSCRQGRSRRTSSCSRSNRSHAGGAEAVPQPEAARRDPDGQGPEPGH